MELKIPKELEGTEEVLKQMFGAVMAVMAFGARKHGTNNWLTDAGTKSSFKEMHHSIWHHVAESFVDGIRYDEGHNFSLRGDYESGIDPLAHAATRCLMQYVRIERRILHPEDR